MTLENIARQYTRDMRNAIVCLGYRDVTAVQCADTVVSYDDMLKLEEDDHLLHECFVQAVKDAYEFFELEYPDGTSWEALESLPRI